MPQNASRLPGRHFLQIPGPTPVPDRVLRAIDMPLIDQRGPEFAKLDRRVLEGIKTIFKTTQPVIVFTRPAPAPGKPRWPTRCRPATACSWSRPASSPRCGRSWRNGWG